GTGVMLTGSHNPSNYNGLKIMINGETLSENSIQILKQRIDTNDFITGNGSCHTTAVHHAYTTNIHKDIKLERPFKVVVDCGNGVAGVIAPHLIETLGCKVIKLFCEVDGNFPNHHPDPSVPNNLEDLISTVKNENADLGLAFDGDGDRLGVVDAAGRIIWPDRQMILYANDLLQRQPGAEIIYDVKCSRHLADSIEKQGGKATMWKTGHSLIKSKMKDTGALLAGEMSGHIFFKERWYGFDDAIYTAARLLEILAKDKRSPTKVFATLPNAVNTPELKIELEKFGEHYELMQKVQDSFKFDEAKITTIDGIRADFNDGWGLVRPSNTTPCLVIRFEANDQATLEMIQSQFRRQFLAIDNRLKLPF
ncbi:phosphomannomutase/phosphoglucomutase, partial [Thiotrichales bacterium HSG1]|nr:phosphomannomutase/phosphoglucomutase [Thiotrichales bacterium HSG1]